MSEKIFMSLLLQVPLPNYGMGRKLILNAPITLKDAIELTKKHLNLPHLRVAIKHGGSEGKQCSISEFTKPITLKLCHIQNV